MHGSTVGDCIFVCLHKSQLFENETEMLTLGHQS